MTPIVSHAYRQWPDLKPSSEFLRLLSRRQLASGRGKERRVTNNLKVTRGSMPEAAEFVDALHASIITAGTHNAQEVGHHPDVILAGRRTNDGMGEYVANQVIRLMVRNGINPVRARILILGLAFKENCPDLRNTRVVDIIGALQGYNARVDVCDPWVDAGEAKHEYGLSLCKPGEGEYDAIVVAVGHEEFRKLGAAGIRAHGKPGAVLYDVKYVLPREAVDGRL